MINKKTNELIDYIKSLDGVGSKSQVQENVKDKFNLTKDRSVFYSENYAVRFSYSKSSSFSNTVLALSTLQKYDENPFFVCLVTPEENIVYLSNSTFLKKISHSSQELRVDNIRGSFNGSDIMKKFDGLEEEDAIENKPENFGKLFAIHRELGFEGNLPRLVEETNNIVASGSKFHVDDEAKSMILSAPQRAEKFNNSDEYWQLKSELDKRVEKHKKEIAIASLIENVNIRGRAIEYLVAGDNDELKETLIEELNKEDARVSRFSTDNKLGDYLRNFDGYRTVTDIKTKVMVLHSNPKAYNVDKMLEFISGEDTVFMFYFIGIEPNEITSQVLLSPFQTDLLESTVVLSHWAGRNSRGVTQFEGKTVRKLLMSSDNSIDIEKAENFLDKLINL